ncbi:hypothetical protein Taro_052996 [Colocasia esculenta]|uniref:Uncharacterized protein n=1 Tax=Colocasia esculenta TaxID=4460 RepID=A0A843XLB3_COLES|nr:hypothetical protein [Colocasia esculenta]
MAKALKPFTTGSGFETQNGGRGALWKEEVAQSGIDGEIWCSAVGFYILLRAVDRFEANYNRFPGVFDGYDTKFIPFRCNASALSEDLISEICRFGAAELHAVAAFVGGVASQEVIKLITQQFVPLSGTFIFNGIDHKSQVLPL